MRPIDVVEQCRILEPLAFAIRQSVDAARVIEQRRRQPRNLLRVLGPVVAALGQSDHAAAPDVGIPIRVRDFLAVPRDVIEDEPLAQRQIAERELGGTEPAHDRVQQDGAGNRQIGAARVEAGDAKPLLEVQRRERLAHAAQLFRRYAAVSERGARAAALFGGDDRAEAEHGARRADHAIEPRFGDLVQVPVKNGFDMPHQLPLVARGDGIALHEPLGEADDAELEAAPELDVRAQTPRDFDAAAADVDREGDFAPRARAVRSGQMDEPGFLGS